MDDVMISGQPPIRSDLDGTDGTDAALACPHSRGVSRPTVPRRPPRNPSRHVPFVVQVIFDEAIDEPRLFRERDVGGVDEANTRNQQKSGRDAVSTDSDSGTVNNDEGRLIKEPR